MVASGRASAAVLRAGNASKDQGANGSQTGSPERWPAEGPPWERAVSARHASNAPSVGRGRRGRARDDFQQLDLEHERGAPGDGLVTTVTVGEIGRADQARLAADLHPLHTFGPA